MVAINPAIPIITLKVSSLNTSVKRKKLSEEIKKIKDHMISSLQETRPKYKDIQIM